MVRARRRSIRRRSRRRPRSTRCGIAAEPTSRRRTTWALAENKASIQASSNGGDPQPPEESNTRNWDARRQCSRPVQYIVNKWGGLPPPSSNPVAGRSLPPRIHHLDLDFLPASSTWTLPGDDEPFVINPQIKAHFEQWHKGRARNPLRRTAAGSRGRGAAGNLGRPPRPTGLSRKRRRGRMTEQPAGAGTGRGRSGACCGKLRWAPSGRRRVAARQAFTSVRCGWGPAEDRGGRRRGGRPGGRDTVGRDPWPPRRARLGPATIPVMAGQGALVINGAA